MIPNLLLVVVKMNMLDVKVVKCFGFCLILNCSVVSATEGGGSNYLPGFYGDLAMAVFPEPGTYFNNFFAAYQDTEAQTGTLLEMPGVLHVSEFEILGGQFVTGFYPGMMAAKADATNNQFDRVGLGDFYLVPGGVSWKWDNLHAFFFEGVVAPTGRYQANDFNLGRNYWTFDHNLLLTWNLPANMEVSVAMGYMNNLENTTTQYRSGDEFHLDYTLGHYPISSFGFGVTGSYYQQVTGDRAAPEQVVTAPGEASSLGPVVMYMPRINGQDAAISFKYIREFNVSGRLPQEYLICRLFMSF